MKNIPDIISLTELRYKTSLLLRKVVDEQKPLILVKKSKKIALILPFSEDLGEERPGNALKVKPYPLAVPKKIRRNLIYKSYLDKKIK